MLMRHLVNSALGLAELSFSSCIGVCGQYNLKSMLWIEGGGSIFEQRVF